MRRRYTTFIFDMDGTTFDTRSFHHSIAEKYDIAQFSVYGNRARVIYEGCDGSASTSTKLKASGVPEDKLEAALLERKRLYVEYGEEYAGNIRMAKGLQGALGRARQAGYRTILLSNSMDEAVKVICEVQGTMNQFDIISGATLATPEKSDRLRDLLEILHLDSATCLCFGDSFTDHEIAARFGIDFCFVNSDFAWCDNPSELIRRCQPKYVIRDFTSVPEFLE